MQKYILLLLALAGIAAGAGSASSLGGGGTVEGTVVDPSGAVVANAHLQLHNQLTGYVRKTRTDANGTFQFGNVPPNPYHLDVTADGFAPLDHDVTVRTNVPIQLKLALTIAGAHTEVTVEAAGANLLENVPYAHNDVDQSLYSKLPASSPGTALSDAVTLATPGVVADSNGFFHPLGDHAQTSFSIDGQPIGDQQSKGFSTQIPLNAIQSMELITGAPGAEFGDKTSLVVNASTKSGLGQAPAGSVAVDYGSFGTIGEETAIALGTPKFGNFLSANATRSGRFLDAPEFQPLHDKGNNESIFDRVDYQPGGNDAFHVNLFLARNWFQIPNTYDQLSQDQRQQVRTLNVAPGYQHTFNAHTLLTLGMFLRADFVNYHPSRDAFADSPATLSQSRRLLNYGFKSDLGYVRGVHNIKAGVQLMQTRLKEDFTLGITDPGFNAVCLDASGGAAALPGVTDPAWCGAAGYTANPDLVTGLVPYDLTRGGSRLTFRDSDNINQYAVYVSDAITLGGWTLSPGLRIDRYDGLSQATSVEPRLGLSYLLKPTATVLRGAYSRTLETPYNENLLLSSVTGIGGLGSGAFGAYGVEPLKPGHRNQFNAGVQQSLFRFLQVDADYFWKFTDNAYDFDTLFSTPITFPISWRKSKLDGVSVRVGTAEFKGVQAYSTMGHTRARFFGPETGGLIFNSPVNTGVFRIDHDQAFQQTTHVRYQFPKKGPWLAFTWRYDSGLVAGSVASLSDALALTAAQQTAIGFYCGAQQASLAAPITSCAASSWGATRLRIPAEGTANDDHNPSRVAPRHLFDLGAGTDNLFHTERYHTTLRFTVLNLTNHVALYNFLSTFSGTHFVTPRAYQAQIGMTF
jgi:hypothetical protein